jgi:predicted phage terminase large subunit-like protein
MDHMTREEALAEFNAVGAELARRRLCDFASWTNKAYRANWHHKRLAAALDRVESGALKRLMVFMPPQNGKSELVTRRFPAFALGRNPDRKIISCSYSADLASEMSLDVQKVMAQPEYRELFPGTRLASEKDDEVKTASKFAVVGRAGKYATAGVGGGITGKSMDIGIIDDPIKSRAEAESVAYRKAVKNWYVNDFSTRGQGDQTAIVLVQTRWHTDDLAGWLLKVAAENPKADQWEVIDFPAICVEERPNDPRKPGDPLWPERFSAAWLEARRLGMGVYDWSALYQQTPVPPGGAMAQLAWFPIRERRAGVRRRMRAWDLAATKETSGNEPAWTVGTLVAEYLDGTYCVEHVVRVRETPAAVDMVMRQTAMADGRSVAIREWEDPGQAGKAVTAAHRKLLAGFDYDCVRASGEKTQQWRPFLVQAEGGNVWLAPGPWNRAWLDEMITVPYGLFFDQADSVALAFNELTAHVDRGADVATVMPRAETDWQSAFYAR